jgi:hypothetical protein
MDLSLEAVTLFAPGFEGWEESLELLQNDTVHFNNSYLSPYRPQFLPANERRRTTPTINLALRAAEDLALQYQQSEHPFSFDQLPVVFISNDGDTDIAMSLCEAVMDDEPMVSPIQFHNSVHNAPAGYWMIGQHSQQPATSLSADKYSIAQGLLEGYFQSKEHDRPVVVISYDLPVNEGINFEDSCSKLCSIGFVVSHQESDKSISRLSMMFDRSEGDNSESEWAITNNPSSSTFPLLSAIAKKESSTFSFPFSGQHVLHVSLIN